MDNSSKDLSVKHHLSAFARELLQSGEAIWRGGKPGLASAVPLIQKNGKSLGEMVTEDRWW